MDNPVQPFLNPILSVSDGSAITHAGEAANRAAADYHLTDSDYRQRRAAKTIKTQTAALLLWGQSRRGQRVADRSDRLGADLF